MIWLRLAFREIRNSRRFSLFFVLNLVLGLFGFIALDALKVSIQRSLDARSKLLLTADLAVWSERPLVQDEETILRQALGSQAKETQLLMLYSMVASATGSRLAELTAIDGNYPFYGSITLEPGGVITGESRKVITQDATVWLYPELASPLHVKPGDLLSVGERSFRFESVVTGDTGNGWRLFDLAPRLYMGRNQLESTHLLQKGSRIWYARLYKLPESVDADALANRLDQRLKDPGIEVQSARQSSDSVGRLQGFLNDYLGLVALVAVFLAALGAAYLFRSFLASRFKEIAILRSLGVTAARARRVYLLQVGMLGAAAAFLASGLAAALLPFAIRALGRFLAYPVQATLRPESFLIGLVISVGGSLLVCGPFLDQIETLDPSALFHENAPESLLLKKSIWKRILPAIALYWCLALWQAHSWKVGSLFMGFFAAAGILIGVTGYFLLAFIQRLPSGASWTRRHVVRTLSRGKVSALSIFVALGLGATLLSLIPQVEKSLETEIERPAVSAVPGLFVFDIQENQVDALKAFVKSRGYDLSQMTPLIRGRLATVNGVPFEKVEVDPKKQSRERQREARFRNRGFNLTFRNDLSESEKIVSGREFSGVYQGDSSVGPPAEISVEREFAKRLKLHLGDVLDFDIQGIPVRGKIVNLRKVQWASFQPNFFVQFQSGVLEGAPKSYLASISHLDRPQRIALQDAIVARFPNVSLIDIAQLVQKILSIFSQMGWAIRLMALFSLLAGLAVMFSIANHQANTRQGETALLKVLGARFSDLRAVYAWEFGGIAVLASLTGTLLSVCMSFAFSKLIFDGVWAFSWQSPLALLLTVPFFSLITLRLATGRVLRRKPLALLQENPNP